MCDSLVLNSSIGVGWAKEIGEVETCLRHTKEIAFFDQRPGNEVVLERTSISTIQNQECTTRLNTINMMTSKIENYKKGCSKEGVKY